MKMVLTGIVASVVLGVVAAFALRAVQEPAYEAFRTPSTRVEPGHNLVGPRWNGQADIHRKNS